MSDLINSNLLQIGSGSKINYVKMYLDNLVIILTHIFSNNLKFLSIISLISK
jgi:hypothetical protein